MTDHAAWHDGGQARRGGRYGKDLNPRLERPNKCLVRRRISRFEGSASPVKRVVSLKTNSLVRGQTEDSASKQSLISLLRVPTSLTRPTSWLSEGTCRGHQLYSGGSPREVSGTCELKDLCGPARRICVRTSYKPTTMPFSAPVERAASSEGLRKNVSDQYRVRPSSVRKGRS